MFFLVYIPLVLYFLIEFMRCSPVKEEKQNRGSTFLIGVVFALMVIVPELIYPFVHIWRLPHYALTIGIIVGLVGVLVRFSAVTTLGRFYSRNVGIQEKHELIQTGWYRIIRHPGYLGTLLTFLGYAIATQSVLSVIINMVLFFVAYSYRIRTEEAALVSQFGDSYRQYQKKTWRIIPFIY